MNSLVINNGSIDKTTPNNDSTNFIANVLKGNPVKPLVKQNKHIALGKDNNTPKAIITPQRSTIGATVKLWFQPSALIKEIENEESTSVVNQTRKV